MSSRRLWIAAAAGALVLAVLALGAATLTGGGFLSGPDVALEEVARGAFTRAVSAEGTLSAVHVTPIVVPTDVRAMQKIAWIATNGSTVKSGEPVVLFDPSTAERTLADGRSGQETANRKIEKARAEGRSASESLKVDRAIAGEELTRAESRARKDDRIFTRNEIIESEIDRDLLTSKVSASEVKTDVSAKKGEADVALEVIAREKAEISIRQAEKGLASLRILAPHDGFFVLERSWRGDAAFSVGATVWPGQKIAELPDLSSLEAKVYVLEADAGGLQPGCEAVVTIEGRPGTGYPGKVSRVDAIAKTREQDVPTKYFETIVSLDRTDPALMKPGQTVRARITLENVPDAITVPRQAVFEKDGRRIVYRMESGRLAPAEVTVGHSGPARVVIEKGLEPGDRIALRDPAKQASDIFSAKGGTGEEASGGGSAGGGEGGGS